MRPPTRLDMSERRFLGLTYRQLAILATAAVIALGCLVGMKTWPIWLRIVLVLIAVGVGLIWAFWEAQGQTLEQRLLDLLVFRRRTRHLLHRALRQSDAGRASWPTAEATPRPASRTAPIASALTWQPGLLWITANTLGVTILTMLTLWLYQGGAHQLALIWRSL